MNNIRLISLSLSEAIITFKTLNNDRLIKFGVYCKHSPMQKIMRSSLLEFFSLKTLFYTLIIIVKLFKTLKDFL